MRRNKKKKIIIISLIGILILMTVGYAAFNTNLEIKGTSKINSNWNVLITNVTKSNVEGTAEETKAPTWDNLTAYMEADLYEKGDSIEYDVTVENRGTLDAKLENITENIKTTNEAVKITFTGYTKGEKLYKNTTKTIKVKIEYNPEFEGKAEEGSGETSITLDYTQAEGTAVTPTDKYLVTYNCTENGGKDCSSYNEYLSEGDTVNLSKTSEKEGYTFIGWNTDKEATEGLTSLQMLNQDITLYAIFKDTTPPECTITVTEATVDGVTLKAACTDASGIKEYKYLQKDNTETTDKNTYNFDNYNLSEIIVEVTDNANNKGTFNISEDNLQKGYQMIYNSLNKKYDEVSKKDKQYEEDFLDKTYPVGSIYISSNNENPNEVVGGTWEEYGKGRTLVGVDPNDVNFNEVNKTGGSKTNTLAVTNLPGHTHSIPALTGSAASAGSHTHSIPALSGSTNSAGAHTHGLTYADDKGTIAHWGIAWKTSTTSKSGNSDAVNSADAHTHTVTTVANTSGSNGAHTHTVTTTASNTGNIGSGVAFANLSPYISVYMWKRVN